MVIRAKRCIALLLFLLAPLCLNSCIEGEEEVWVNPDASGRAHVKLTAPTLLFSRFGGVEQIIADAKEGLATSENVTLTHLEATKDGSQTTLTAKLSFKDARKIGSVLQQFRDPLDSPEKCDEEILFGDTNLEVSFPEILFSRAIDIRPLIPPESLNPMTTRLLGDSKLIYKIHLPTPASTHNANQVSNDGKSLQWQVPLTTLLAGPIEIKFTAPIPHLTRYLTLAGILLFLVTSLLIFLIKRRTISASTPS